MPSWKEVGLGSGFLTVETLGTRTIVDNVVTVYPDDYQGTPTLTMELEKSKYKVSLNQTSCKRLSELWGNNYIDWINKQVSIKMETITVNNLPTQVKVVSPIPAPAPAAASKSRRK